MYKKSAAGWLKHLDFIILDLICLELAFILSYIIRHGFSNPFKDVSYRNLGIVILIIDFLLLIVTDNFKNVLKRGLYAELIKTSYNAGFFILFLTAYLFAIQEGEIYSRTTVITTGIIYFILTYTARISWKKHIKKNLGRKGEKSLIIVSSKKRASEVYENIMRNNIGSYVITGWIFRNPENIGKYIENIPVVASYENAVDYVKSHWVDEVLVAVPAYDNFPRELIDRLTEMGVTVHINLDKTESIDNMKQVVGNIGGMRVITASMNVMTVFQSAAKRLLDIIGGIVGCAITGILFIFLAPAIKKESPGPVFFCQTRIGRNGKPFKIYKFRSMYLDAEQRKAELMEQNKLDTNLMFKMDFDPRVIGNYIDENGSRHTGIGEFMRKYSLDEFPQFLNVLLGSMSLVGTRPPTVEEVKQYDTHHRTRLAIKPGITGMWQVSGRSDITDFEEVVNPDTQYINNWSIEMDIKILFKTVAVVLKKDGAM